MSSVKMSNGVEWALHYCVVLTQSATPVPAAQLAELYSLPPAYAAKQLQSLAGAMVVRATAGKVGGYSLSRPATDISVLDVVRAIDGDEPAFRCNEIRGQGPLAVRPQDCPRPCAIARVMAQAEHAWSVTLSRVTIADLAREIDTDSSGTAMPAVKQWLTDRSIQRASGPL